jgi:hypothetical protein
MARRTAPGKIVRVIGGAATGAFGDLLHGLDWRA